MIGSRQFADWFVYGERMLLLSGNSTSAPWAALQVGCERLAFFQKKFFWPSPLDVREVSFGARHGWA